MRTFEWDETSALGLQGVELVKTVLGERYPLVSDLAEDMQLQAQGVDLQLEKLGYVEVKTDTHEPKTLFIEVGPPGGTPGAIDKCISTTIIYVFPLSRTLFIIPRPQLTKWLRDNWGWLSPRNIRTVWTSRGGQRWSVVGVIVPVDKLLADTSTERVTWEPPAGSFDWEDGE
jgi:hypothetical protein